MKIDKIGIVGTGAVGGYFGGKLAKAEFEVVFLSRGETLKVIGKQGLTVNSLGETFTIKDAVFTENASHLKDCDLILFTVKSYDTKSTIDQIKKQIKAEAIILTPQNGISNDRMLAREFGTKRIIPAFAKIGVGMPKPGYIEHTGLGILSFGEYDGKKTARIKSIADLLKRADIQYELPDDIQAARWRKFIWNSTFNMICLLTQQPVDIILDNKRTYDLCVSTIKEIEKIALAEGVDFQGEDVVEKRVELARALGHFKPSTLEDFEKGKKLEIDIFTGEVMRLSEKQNIAVPINKVLYALLQGKTA